MSADQVNGYVVIGGVHPLGELELYGPFASVEEAHTWAEEHLAPVGDWWMSPVWKAEA